MRRGPLARLLAVVFVFNPLVMGAGALYSYEHTPPIPTEVHA
ncbi:hypothetical protein [Haloarchaeobius litoreus]|uniref:Uncharacterized protein n=1 Tax=Haloarchaeobius litoreus TaxID=755306 RepID=A0ABD6DI78_9EURY|nr:hypothetical protein [Haloarchaeobius litoreus]